MAEELPYLARMGEAQQDELSHFSRNLGQNALLAALQAFVVDSALRGGVSSAGELASFGYGRVFYSWDNDAGILNIRLGLEIE